MIPPAPKATTPRALDRALSLPLLDSVYRIAQLSVGVEEKSQLLSIALREYVTEADADNKMKKTVTRIWINPPTPAVSMITWAIKHPEHFPDHRVLHVGALLATVPYVGSILAQLGRAFNLDNHLTVVDLRRKITAIWGGSSTIAEGVGKTVTTLRRLDTLVGGGAQELGKAEPLPTTGLGAAWLIHATMLQRQVHSLDALEAQQTPELFWTQELRPDQHYPYLELHTEGVKRRVWVIPE